MKSGAAPPRPLRIVVHGLNERAYALLSMMLAGPDWRDCTLVGSGTADLGIVDLDTPAPERTWKEFRSRHPDLPAIVLSVREQQRDNARHLRKPVDRTLLRNAINATRDAADAARLRPSPANALPAGTPAAGAASASDRVQPDAPRAFAPFARRAPDAAPPTPTRLATTELDRETEERNCGAAHDADLSDRRAWARCTYDPAGHFQRVLEAAIAAVRSTGVPHAIEGLPAPLHVHPGRPPRFETPLKDTVLRSLCTIALQPGTMRVAPLSGIPPGTAGGSAEALLWQVALWTARGRLPRGIDPDTPVRLTRWPDFTRLAQTPHAMRIAAVLVGSVHTPRVLCAELSIAQRYVFSFLAAAATTPLLEALPVHAAARHAAPDSPAAPSAHAASTRAPTVAPSVARTSSAPRRAPGPSPLRALLSRILGRLAGSAE